jgi:hypothetical protein
MYDRQAGAPVFGVFGFFVYTAGYHEDPTRQSPLRLMSSSRVNSQASSVNRKAPTRSEKDRQEAPVRRLR